MEQLEDEYPGDSDWNVFVRLYEEDYLDDNARTLAKVMDGYLDMAVVLNGKRGLEEGLWWIKQKVPALGNKRPADCLKNPKLIKRLRMALMSMP
ncbi:hypothetical protein ACVK1X_006277 [Pseudomonas sp. PvR086]|jgi:hypothetical protein|uniref:Antitoxin Xre/MbcA/ParS-like toxin-binding domain-containing protein n=1 Tax=Pseudomonas frederiksbergensis TaxID=104087 RepID=A0A2S8HLZ1_9PSED|nr:MULTISPECIES: hypothetical protein [Pseudomonas]MBD9609834.1 hypothetical protein [Pseudomonas sp. PDM08]MDR7110127.1 hypothetical protein [Pseudomonas frederiksbergensis]PMY44286.1 hypothetical protein C1X70_30130 [Pseudomonas sp. FW305-53]PMY83365.1 hypothetical protein C1X68_30120 [Pseudomonas sp. FW303-C2]PMY89273.1 hypothetical protein C1X67_29920 [Pseudomonas sp. FW305-62]